MFKTIIKILQRIEDKIDPPKSTMIKTNSDDAWKAFNSKPTQPIEKYVPGQTFSVGSCSYPSFYFNGLERMRKLEDETHP